MDDISKKKPTTSGSVLHALLPGARIEGLPHNNKVRINVKATDNRHIILNIGGARFETYRSTLRRVPDSVFCDEDFMKKHYHQETDEYFFDRDPDTFKAVLNYLRTGELHIPSYICGPAAKRELDYWRINDYSIERCCWTNYVSWNQTQEALDRLEQDRRSTFMDFPDSDNTKLAKLSRIKLRTWQFLSDPSSSTAAKIYGWISLVFVFASIFSFCAETHVAFRVYGRKDIIGREYVLNTQNVTHNESGQVSIREEYVGPPNMPHTALLILNIICMVFFTIEYVLRVCTAPKRLGYILSAFGFIDLIALIPDYVEITIEPFLEPGNQFLRFIPLLRIMRVCRILRLIRHFSALWVLFYTLKASLKELVLIAIFLLVGVLMFASLIFFADDNETFTSIPHSFWWALITMTTVGYGDMYPVTAWGYVVGSGAALSGLLMVGFSVPVLVNNFILYYKHIQYLLEKDTEEPQMDNNNRRRPSTMYIKTKTSVESLPMTELSFTSRETTDL